jgi:hypothetical protein
MRNFKQYLFWIMIFSPLSCLALSAAYYYELYIHNEYKAEPPGLPKKFILSPIIGSFSGGRRGQWHEHRFAAGLIEALRLTYGHTWIEFITAIGKERVRLNQQGIISKKSRFGMDDFLIDIGHNILDETGKKQLLLHWLTGIPLAKKVTLAEVNQPLWGTRTYATGPVIEGVYEFIRSEEYDIFVGLIARFLHRFKRHYIPILPADAFFRPGNTLDILALFHYRYNEQNIEFGYIFSRYNHAAYQFPDQTQPLLSEQYKINISKTWGKPYHGVTVFGTLSIYF